NEREFTGTKVRPIFCTAWVSICPGGAASARGAYHGSVDGVSEAGGQLFPGSRPATSDLCNSVGLGDSERAAVQRDRREGSPDRGSQPAQVGVSRQHVA